MLDKKVWSTPHNDVKQYGQHVTRVFFCVTSSLCDELTGSLLQCQSAHSLMPKYLGAEVSWGRTVQTLRHLDLDLVLKCLLDKRIVLGPKCPVTLQKQIGQTGEFQKDGSVMVICGQRPLRPSQPPPPFW